MEISWPNKTFFHSMACLAWAVDNFRAIVEQRHLLFTNIQMLQPLISFRTANPPKPQNQQTSLVAILCRDRLPEFRNGTSLKDWIDWNLSNTTQYVLQRRHWSYIFIQLVLIYEMCLIESFMREIAFWNSKCFVQRSSLTTCKSFQWGKISNVFCFTMSKELHYIDVLLIL